MRPLACWDRGFESHREHGCLSVAIVVFCHLEVSAKGWSLVQRSPTDCAASVVCDLEKPREWGGHSPRNWAAAPKERKKKMDLYFYVWTLPEKISYVCVVITDFKIIFWCIFAYEIATVYAGVRFPWCPLSYRNVSCNFLFVCWTTLACISALLWWRNTISICHSSVRHVAEVMGWLLIERQQAFSLAHGT